MAEKMAWTITISLEESPERTDARALLMVGERQFGGWGRARRNPADPDVPRIGEELAVARALSDLSHNLIEAAVAEIETREGHEVKIHP